MRIQREASTGWPVGTGLLALCLASIYQIFLISQPLEFLITSVYERDDAFYYLLIARNIAEHRVATFDGIHLSNGVQLLWNLMLVLVANFFADPIHYMRAVLAVCLIFTFCAGLLLRRLGASVVSPAFGDILVFLFAGVMVERWNTLQGMEYSLHLTVILGTIIVSLRTISLPNGTRMFILGCLLTLNYWVRLDAVLFSIAIWTAVAWHNVSRETIGTAIKYTSLMTIVPALGAIGYVALSYHWAETWLPLSGAVKSYYAGQFFGDTSFTEMLTVQIKMWVKINLHAFLGLVPQNILDLGLARLPNPFSKPEDLILVTMPVILTAFGILAIGLNTKLRARFGMWIKPLIFLLSICWIHAAISVFALKDFSHVTRHYYGWYLIFWLLWGATLIMCFLGFVAAKAKTVLSTTLIAGYAVSYLFVATAFLSKPIDEWAYSIIRYDLAQELNDSLPKGAIVAAWNAGLLGYFLDRPVVNLDGLVNDAAFLEILKSGAPLAPYLKSENVTHLIDHNARDLTLNYRENRDTDREYRNGVTWEDVQIFDKVGAIYVLELVRGIGD